MPNHQTKLITKPHTSSFLHLISLTPLISLIPLFPPTLAQSLSQGIPATVDFSKNIREWDGFGVEYVETAQTGDYGAFSQDVGGYSILTEKQQQEITHLIFGEDGWKVSLLSLPLDPFHQNKLGGKFDHETTTENLRSFAKQGVELSQSRGSNLHILTTLWAPPAFLTKQKTLSGRDLNLKQADALGTYMIDWVSYLRSTEGLPVSYLSLHNGGEAWQQWNGDGKPLSKEQQYNVYMPASQIASLLGSLPSQLEKAQLGDLKISIGSPSTWERFHTWGYANAILSHPGTLAQVGLLTAQGRGTESYHSGGILQLQAQKPGLHAWSTAMEWGEMDTEFVQRIYQQIALNGVNAIIPSIGMLQPAHWLPKETPPSAPITVVEEGEGSYSIHRGYHFYKQVSRAGQDGMTVVQSATQDPNISILGFGSNGTEHPDAFVVINTGQEEYSRGDGIDVTLGPGQYHFNLTDPVINFNYRRPESVEKLRFTTVDSRVKFAKRFTSNGYVVELALPKVGSFGRSNAMSRNLRCQLQVHDRSYLHEQVLNWNVGKTLRLATQEGGDVQFVPEAPVVDGEIDILWEDATFHKLGFEDQPDFSAHLRLLNTPTNLYFLIEVDEPSAFPGKTVAIEVKGSSYQKFEAFRTTDDGEEYQFVGTFEVKNGMLQYNSPSHSVTTFFGVK